MFKSRSFIALVTGLALVAGSATALADPGNGNGQGQGHGRGFSQDVQEQGHPGGHGKGRKSGGDDWGHGPNIDRGAVIGVIGGYRDYWSPGPALPPGIQKKLARGRPLPPGIAKKLDGRLVMQLPRYEGYEWQQVGTDLILVSIASGLIYEVLNGALN